MKLKPSNSEELDESSEMIGTIEIDQAGERGLWVRLADGRDIGQLESVLGHFAVVELSDDEHAIIRRMFETRKMAGLADDLGRRSDEVEQTLQEMLARCDEFLKLASGVGFRLSDVPGIPGSFWDPTISVEHWGAIVPECGSQILRGLLIAVDWNQKLREWNFDSVTTEVVGPDGHVRATISLRKGYDGPIA